MRRSPFSQPIRSTTGSEGGGDLGSERAEEGGGDQNKTNVGYLWEQERVVETCEADGRRVRLLGLRVHRSQSLAVDTGA